MGFLNGIFFFALGATLLPIIIHILNRRRIRKIRFSSLDFIHEVSKRRMSKINFRRWIILALRTLAVAFVVMAFARPTLQGGAPFFIPGDTPKNIIVCVDRSYSMGVEQEQGTAFTRAQEIAREVVEQAGKHDEINVVAFAERSETLFESGIRNKQLVKATLDRLNVGAEGTSVARAVETALDLVRESDIKGGEIYVISDFRVTTDSLIVPEETHGARVMLLPVYTGAVDNVSIDRIFTPRKLIRPGEVVHVGVALTNHSMVSPADFHLEFVVGGERKAEKVVNLSPASSTTLSFPVTFQRWGTYRCRIAKARDRLMIDDDRYFLLEVSKTVPVTLVRGRRWLEDGKQAASHFFVSKSLNPRGGSEGEFTVNVVDENGLTASSLPGRGAVVWTEPQGLERQRLDLLKRYVHGGGSLVVFLGPQRKGLWRDEAFLRYIGARAAALKERPGGENFASYQYDHPVFSIFSEEELELLSRSRIGRYVAVSGVPPDSILAYLGSGDPGIWECTRGNGRILVFATAPEMTSGDLPLSPMFLPLVHTSVSYMASAGGAEFYKENHVGKDLHFDLPQTAKAQEDELRIKKPGGGAVRPVFYESPQGNLQAICERPDAVGFYRVDVDSMPLAEAAVNVETAESNLNPLERADEVFGPGQVVDTSGDLPDALLVAKQGREVYTLFLLLAISALVLEAVLGRRA